VKYSNIFLGFLFFLSCAPGETEPEKFPELVLTAYRYGTSRFPANQIRYHAVESETVDFAWMFFSLESEGRTMLVDAGYSQPLWSNIFKVQFQNPLSLLAGNGIQPTDVDTIIVTHAHFDHAENAHLFPNADIWISRAAWSELGKNRSLNETYQALLASDKVKFLEQDTWFWNETLKAVLVDGHARGSLAVEVHTREGLLFLMGDEAYLPEQVGSTENNPAAVNAENNRTFLDKVKSSEGSVFCSHDPLLTEGLPYKSWNYSLPLLPDKPVSF